MTCSEEDDEEEQQQLFAMLVISVTSHVQRTGNAGQTATPSLNSHSETYPEPSNTQCL